jgi:alkaline phosphatase
LLYLFFNFLIAPNQHNEKDFHRISDLGMHPELEHVQQKSSKFRAMENEFDPNYWLNQAKEVVQEQLKKMPNTKKAKNVIMFLGDGMSHPTIAAARVYMGGEEKKLSFENMPFTANSKTYCVDVQVADSACTATAYLHGVKANDATIGVNANVPRSDCNGDRVPEKQTESIASWAMKAGKDAGFVTTTRVTHASPTGVYAHTADRDWEDDVEVRESGCNPDLVDDIAEQLVHGEVSKKLKVMMGGGSRHFIDRRYQEHGAPGYRSDGKHLINEWKAADPERTYVSNKQELMNLDPTKVKQVLGMFNTAHIDYNLDIQRDNLQDIQPSLTNLTIKAIDILSQNPEGYFLFVEGGRIDHGHHKNEAKHAVDETAEFSKAIQATMDHVNLEETLIVVTADHGHVMTLAGYAVSLIYNIFFRYFTDKIIQHRLGAMIFLASLEKVKIIFLI